MNIRLIKFKKKQQTKQKTLILHSVTLKKLILNNFFSFFFSTLI